MFGMLTDNLRPDKGSITADGEDIYKMGADYRAKIGYMPQQQSLYEAFTAEKFLWYMAALKGMNRKDAREQIENLLEVVNLKEERYKKLKYFSGGMKQRILLAQALLNDPEILFWMNQRLGWIRRKESGYEILSVAVQRIRLSF